MKEYRKMFADVAAVSGPVLLDEAFGTVAGAFLLALINRLGSCYLSEYTVAGLVQITLIGVIGSIGTGAAVMIARAIGAYDWHSARSIAGNALLISFLLGIGLGTVGWQLDDQLLRLLRNGISPSDSIQRLSDFAWLALPFLLSMQVGKSIMQGMGATADAFRLNAFYLITGLGLGSAFVFLRPELGILAVALGISLSAVLGLVFCLILLWRHSELEFSWRQLLHPGEWGIVQSLWRLSVPVFIEQSLLQTGFSLYVFMLVDIGAQAFSANQVTQQLEGVSLAIGSCLAVATLTLVGKALGKNDHGQSKRYIQFILCVTVISMTACGLGLVFFAEELIGLLTNDLIVKDWATGCIFFVLLEQPTIAVTLVLGNALRAAGDTKWPMLSTIAGMWLVRIPLCLLLIRGLGCDITIAWVITAFDYLVRSVILVLRYRALQRLG